mmetsp:Transcript_27990/g.94263  ORF Transcript_27990/g.94263 Transcript_27990/m.94263 type:complete len:288 (+) Transcript_27990:1067-1930(+)
MRWSAFSFCVSAKKTPITAGTAKKFKGSKQCATAATKFNADTAAEILKLSHSKMLRTNRMSFAREPSCRDPNAGIGPALRPARLIILRAMPLTGPLDSSFKAASSFFRNDMDTDGPRGFLTETGSTKSSSSSSSSSITSVSSTNALGGLSVKIGDSRHMVENSSSDIVPPLSASALANMASTSSSDGCGFCWAFDISLKATPISCLSKDPPPSVSIFKNTAAMPALTFSVKRFCRRFARRRTNKPKWNIAQKRSMKTPTKSPIESHFLECPLSFHEAAFKKLKARFW